MLQATTVIGITIFIMCSNQNLKLEPCPEIMFDKDLTGSNLSKDLITVAREKVFTIEFDDSDYANILEPKIFTFIKDINLRDVYKCDVIDLL